MICRILPLLWAGSTRRSKRSYLRAIICIGESRNGLPWLGTRGPWNSEQKFYESRGAPRVKMAVVIMTLLRFEIQGWHTYAILASTLCHIKETS